MHVSTVSRVLNGDPGLSVRPETIERILTTARTQGYRPNALARALRRDRTGAFAFVVPLLRNPIWVRLQRGALQRAGERGYVVMMMEEPTDAPKPPGTYRYLVEESRADGLLLATALRRTGPDAGVHEIPHVYVNRRGPDRGNDVVMDEAGAVRLFIDHVASLGHRSVVLIDGPREVDTVHRRVSAARRHCAALGLDVTIRHAPATEEGGWDTTREMLRAARSRRHAVSAASTSSSGCWPRCVTPAWRSRRRCQSSASTRTSAWPSSRSPSRASACPWPSWAPRRSTPSSPGSRAGRRQTCWSASRCSWCRAHPWHLRPIRAGK